MKTGNIKLPLWLLIMGIFIAYLSGCASTKPNTPYPGPYPLSFNELSMKNTLLAQELGKLPEIQDGISDKEAVALENIVELYNEDPNAFDTAFNEMHKIGKPEVREYCSPLQALFWLTENGLLHMETDLISHYSLERLLSKAWNFDPPVVSDMQILEAINGINDAEIRRQYTDYWKVIGNLRLQKLLVIDLSRIQ